MQRDSNTLEVRHAFGILFIAVSIAVGAATVVGEIAFVSKAPLYYYAIIWIASFSLTFGAILRKSRKTISSIFSRMKNSIQWPTNVKAVNGLCWASPFAVIPLFPHIYHYLILLGIGSGNLSTYLLMKKYSNTDNREQMIVGLISLLAIPIALSIDMTIFISRQDLAILLSRILISMAYGIGGTYAIISKA